MSTIKAKKTSKLLLIAVAIVAAFFLFVIIKWMVPRFKEGNFKQTEQDSSTNNKDLCSTEYCHQAAKNLLKNMNEKVDPCENFYEFSCGSWLQHTKISSDSLSASPMKQLSSELNDAIADLLSSTQSTWTFESTAITNARRLYQSCIDEYAIEAEAWTVMYPLIQKEFGGWPASLASSWDESTFSLSQVLLKSNQYNTFPFYHVKTTIDYNSTDILRYRIRIGPGIQGNDEDSSLINENILTRSYKHLTHDLSSILFKRSSTTYTQDTELDDFAQEIEKHLLTTNEKYSSTDIVTTVKNLSRTINTAFDFSNYVRRLYQIGNVILTDDDIVVVNNIESIRRISTIVARQSPETLHTYLIMHFILSQALHIPKTVRTIFLSQTSTTSGAIQEEPRRISCAKYVNKNMHYAVSKLYIDKYYDKLAHNESIEIVDNIRNTFIYMVTKSVWMDSVSKKNTVEKAQAMRNKVGYPDYLDSNNIAKLENMYSEYQFDSSHMRNVLLLLQLNVKQNLQKIRQPINHQDWTDEDPTTINAYYRPLFNDIIIPAAFFQPPFFHKDAPKYLNYGAIGSIVGHEITHGFDDERRKLDKDGKEYTLWSNETIEMFDKRSKCLIDQYNKYTISQIGLRVNGNKTLDENIADNDGLKKAFYTYQKWAETHKIVEKKLPGLTKYSPEQMFFINFGQSWCSKVTDLFAETLHLIDNHSPSEFRVNGPTSNFREFDRVFGCKAGQGNSRVNKCSAW